jgi:predicted deacetylase
METMKGILIIAYVLFLILAPHDTPAVWVEIHDVSQGYGTDELIKVVEILDRHDVERVVIFVIPNHGGSAPLSEYPEFTNYLKELHGKGYEIGAHGYTHDGFEFYCSRDEVLQRLNLSMEEFHAAGISPRVFLAPRFFVKKESYPMLQENFNEIYFFNKIKKEGQNLPYVIHEFTWFRLPEWAVMPLAKVSYKASRSDVYRLSLHIGKMDEGRLEFLDEFLGFIENA